MNRLEVAEQVLCCERCSLRREANAPVSFHGSTPNRVAVLGEAPGKDEDTQGIPFVGRAGQVLRENLTKAGFDPETLTYFNTASCWPSETKTPQAEHVKACKVNRTAQLDVIQPEWVLAVGNVALSTVRPDLKISKVRGHVLFFEGVRYFFTFHPSAAMRKIATEQRMLEDLKLFRHMIDSEFWASWVCNDCVICSVGEDELGEHDGWLYFDDSGAPFCNECWEVRTREPRRPKPKEQPPLKEQTPEEQLVLV